MKAIVPIPLKNEFPRARALELLLTGIVNLNVEMMRKYRFPPLYQAGIRYSEDPLMWRHAFNVLRHGTADCKSLAAYRAAELIVQGHAASIIVHRTGPTKLHARVCVGGRIEDPKRICRAVDDPSRRLGMGRGRQSASYPELQAKIRSGQIRRM